MQGANKERWQQLCEQAFGRPIAVTNTISIAILLFFLLPVSAAPQEPDNSAKDANEFARSVLTNEAKAEAEDHSHWMFRLETEKSQRKELDEVVETRDGDLKCPVSINGRSLTAKQERDADEAIRRLIRDPKALRVVKERGESRRRPKPRIA